MARSKYYFGVVFVIIIGAILRFFMLSDKSLWLDEGYSLYYSEGSSVQQILSRLFGADTGDRFQPLYYLVLYYWQQIFGNSEFAVRSLSAFLGVGSVIILSYTALQLYGKKHAIWMTLFLSLSSYAIYYSQQTRAYAMLLFLASLQMYFFSKALHPRPTSDEVISRWMFWIITGFSLFCSILIGIFTLSLCLAHIIIYRDIKRWLKWWLPAAIFCLPAVAFYLASPLATTPTKVNVTISRQPVIQNLVFVIYGLLVGETYGPPIEQLRDGNRIQIILNYLPQLLVLIVAIAILVFCLLKVWRLKNHQEQYQKLDNFFALLFTISTTIAILFAIATKMNWLPRHSFYIYIPLAFLIPVVIRKSPINSTRKFNFPQLAVVAILIINVYSTYNYYFNKAYEREDYRVVAQYLVANQSPSVKSILLYGAPNLLPYYGDTKTIDGQGLDTKNLAQEVKRVSNDANKVLIAISFQSFWEFKKNFSLEKSMSSLYNLQSKVSFTNFYIYHYVKK